MSEDLAHVVEGGCTNITHAGLAQKAKAATDGSCIMLGVIWV